MWQSVDIVDVISEHVTLQKKGSLYWCCCPFHSERTPSMAVSKARGTFTCYGCGAHGDAVEFLQKLDNLSFPEAIERLAKKSGIQIMHDHRERTDEEIEASKHRESLLAAIAVAQDFKKRFTTIPNITGPHRLAGEMGAEYFIKKGFRHFAFYGVRGIVWSDERCQGFREAVARANPAFTFSALHNNSQNDLWYYDSTQLIIWLQSLPKPVAIMACDDNQAYHITEACMQIDGGGEFPHSGRHCHPGRRQRRNHLPTLVA